MAGYDRPSTTERTLVNYDDLANLSLLKIQSGPFGNIRDMSRDGDEMNAHSAASVETVAELAELSSAEHHIVSPQGGQCNITIVQDSLLGAYKMTVGDIHITKSSFFNMCNFLDMPTINKKLKHIRKTLRKDFKIKDEIYTGRLLFSMILPDDFNFEGKNDAMESEPILKIRKGIIYKGALNKKNLKSSHTSITLLLNKEYGVKTASEFVDNTQFLTNNWLLSTGFSVGIEDCIATKKSDIEDVIQKCYIEADEIEKTTRHPGIREIKISQALNKARDVGLRIAKNGMSKDNTFKDTVTSGSKGDFFNISQITGLLGQQNVKGKRIEYRLNEGKRSLPCYPLGEVLEKEEKYESRGFVRHSFIHGLNPREFYFHAMTGREGITDTALGTATSGYQQRRIVKLTEDIKVNYDTSVRSSNGDLYQFHYGNNGFDPCKTVKVGGKHKFCDVERLVSKLNTGLEL